jgi:mono/diheme cytochrome c family protein
MGENMNRIAIAIVVSTALISHAFAHEPGDIKRGAALADSVCAQCHAVRAGQLRSPDPMAPSFTSVAKTPGMTDRALRVWLQSSHPTMPNFILSSKERNDVVVYIMSLNTKGSAM